MLKQVALDVLKNRRSIRKFKSEQITDTELDTVLEAGTFAPTAMGTQEPVIVAVQTPATVKQLNQMNAKILGSETTPYYGAPTILLVFAPKDSATGVENGSLVAGNLLNAAYAADLGACWIHRAHEMFELPEGQELMRQWGVGENMQGIASVALGYPDVLQPEAAPRKADYIIKA